MIALREPPTDIDYSKICIRGICDDSAIVSSEFFRQGNVTWDADPTTTEFKIDFDDERYKRCLETAHELKKLYPLDDPNLTRAQLIEREEKIIHALNQKIQSEFGPYNKAVSKALDEGTDPELELSLLDDIKRSRTDNPLKSSELPKGSFICRTFSPMDCNLSEAAGIPNFFVSGYCDSFSMSPGPRGSYGFVGGKHNGIRNRHTFMVSRLTGNIFEGTSVGNPYVRNVSDTSIDQLLHGETIIAAHNEMYIVAYGTGDNGHHPTILQNRREKIACNNVGELPSYPYNDAVPLPPFFCGPTDLPKPSYIESIAAFDKKLMASTYANKISPVLKKLRVAVETSNVATARECCEAFPLSTNYLANTLKEAIANTNLPIAELMIERGALQGTDYIAASNALFALPADKVAANKPFVEAMVKKLDIKPATHLLLAAESKNSEHLDIALERIECEPKTAETKRMLLKTQIKLYKNGNSEAADVIKHFTDNNYKDVEIPKETPKEESVVDIFLKEHPLLPVTDVEQPDQWRPPMMTPLKPAEKTSEKPTQPR